MNWKKWNERSDLRERERVIKLMWKGSSTRWWMTRRLVDEAAMTSLRSRKMKKDDCGLSAVEELWTQSSVVRTSRAVQETRQRWVVPEKNPIAEWSAVGFKRYEPQSSCGEGNRKVEVLTSKSIPAKKSGIWAMPWRAVGVNNQDSWRVDKCSGFSVLVREGNCCRKPAQNIKFDE